jgi:hypothetical protein
MRLFYHDSAVTTT